MNFSIAFYKQHEPLLLLAGSQDHCIPAHLCERVYRSCKSKNPVTEFIVKERNHFVLGLPTWKVDAGFIPKWIKELCT